MKPLNPTLSTLILLSSLTASLAFADNPTPTPSNPAGTIVISEREGGAGTELGMEFSELARNIAHKLTHPDIPVGDLLKKIDAVKPLPTLEDLQIDTTAGKVSVDAINIPDKGQILFNATRWKVLDDSSKQMLVLHEFLGLMQINDDGYHVSRIALGGQYQFQQIQQGGFQQYLGTYYNWTANSYGYDVCSEYGSNNVIIEGRYDLSADLCRAAVGSYYSWSKDDSGYDICDEYGSNSKVLSVGYNVDKNLCRRTEGSYYNWTVNAYGYDVCSEYSKNGLILNGRYDLNADLCRSASGSYFSWTKDNSGYDICDEYGSNGKILSVGYNTDKAKCESGHPGSIIIPTPVQQPPTPGGDPVSPIFTSARNLSLKTIQIEEALESVAKPEENSQYLLPVKVQAAELSAVSLANCESSAKVREEAQKLVDAIDQAKPFVDSVLELDASFEAARQMLEVREQLVAMLGN